MNGHLRQGMVLLAALVAIVVPAAPKADEVADFYSKNNLLIIVPFNAGGGIYAQLLSRHLGRHIPGDDAA